MKTATGVLAKAYLVASIRDGKVFQVGVFSEPSPTNFFGSVVLAWSDDRDFGFARRELIRFYRARYPELAATHEVA